jgi:hypothetical protein
MTLHINKGFGLRKLGVVASVAGMAAVGLAVAPSASASTAATAHLSPASTVITGKTTSAAFAGTVDGFALTVSCTGFTSTGKTPADGLTVPLSKPPTFSGCTDSLGGTDTVTTAGKWKLVANSTGSKFTIDLPVKSATFTSSLLSGCVIQVTPTKAGTLAGKYNNKNTLTITKASFALSGTGCSTGATATATTTITFTPNVSVVG